MNKTRGALAICAALMAACGGGANDRASSQVIGTQAATHAVPNLEAASAAVKPAVSTSTSAPRYSFTILGTLGGPDTIGNGYITDSNRANGINDAGQVVGFSTLPGAERQYRATLWNGATVTDLGAIGGGQSRAQGINNSGQIVGVSLLTGRGQATLWNGTTVTDLGTLGGDRSSAFGINDSGQVVGESTRSDFAMHAALWIGTTLVDLGSLGGRQGAATAINNSGQVVGYSDLPESNTGRSHATLWEGTTVTDLGTFGGTASAAYGINDSGQVVGSSHFAGNTTSHAAIWNGTIVTDLGAQGGNSSEARGVNNSGQVVGYNLLPDNSTTSATLWEGDTATDLNRLLDPGTVSAGWFLRLATAINNKGWIVGVAVNTVTSKQRAYLLTRLADKDQCKDGGWQSFDFPNQGQCIEFVNIGK